MLLRDVQPIAESLLEMLSDPCQEIQIAGSVRRQKPEVHDLEFVLLPKWDEDLLGDKTSTYSDLDMMLYTLVREGVLRWDDEVKRNGPKLKRLIHRASGLIVELYIVDEQNFGNQLTIRTGHKEFSQRLVTPRSQGGAMPFGMRQIDGYLHRNGVVIPCRTEEDFFREIGVKWIAPELRTAGRQPEFVERKAASV